MLLVLNTALALNLIGNVIWRALCHNATQRSWEVLVKICSALGVWRYPPAKYPHQNELTDNQTSDFFSPFP
jgi:hypothetical protein